MQVEQVLRMVGGAGDTSYCTNSTLQEKGILLSKPTLDSAIEEIMMSKKVQDETMVFVDLGCSSSPNTVSFVAQVLDVMSKQCQKLERKPLEAQFFLNDLPKNDFNCLFQLLEKFKEERGELLVPYYIAAVSGSFHTRLFPRTSVDLFYSSYSLHWLSQVPEGLKNDQGVPLNKGNINIASTSPPEVVEAYQKQYQTDFSMFLKHRHAELSNEGQMVLSFIGRKSRHPADSEICFLYRLLADALNSLVSEGRITQDKVDTFEVPFYGPSMQEVKSVILAQGLFDVKQEQIFRYSWDPFVGFVNDVALYNLASGGKNVASCIRAVTEPLISHQFGTTILDELYSRFADNVSCHILEEQAMYIIFLIVLEKKSRNFKL